MWPTRNNRQFWSVSADMRVLGAPQNRSVPKWTWRRCRVCSRYHGAKCQNEHGRADCLLDWARQRDCIWDWTGSSFRKSLHCRLQPFPLWRATFSCLWDIFTCPLCPTLHPGSWIWGTIWLCLFTTLPSWKTWPWKLSRQQRSIWHTTVSCLWDIFHADCTLLCIPVPGYFKKYSLCPTWIRNTIRHNPFVTLHKLDKRPSSLVQAMPGFMGNTSQLISSSSQNTTGHVFTQVAIECSRVLHWKPLQNIFRIYQDLSIIWNRSYRTLRL